VNFLTINRNEGWSLRAIGVVIVVVIIVNNNNNRTASSSKKIKN
jgi:hypothetical protein